MSEINNLNPSQSALSLVLQVKEPIAENAARLREGLKGVTPEGLNNVGTVHFGRFLLLNNDTQFLVFTEYDGSFDTYINDFINETGDVFNFLLSCCVIPDDVLPVQDNRAAFNQLVKENDHKSEVFYCAYPKLSVVEILRNS